MEGEEEEEERFCDNSLNDSNSGDACNRVRELLARARAFQEELRACGGGRGGPIGIARLQKLVRAELSFLTRLSSLSLPSNASACPALRRYGTNWFSKLFGTLPLLSTTAPFSFMVVMATELTVLWQSFQFSIG